MSIEAQKEAATYKVCPFTGREFFMNVVHPELGEVPTYGGPFDSYTIPVPDEDGNLRVERYDHDAGDWVEGGEPVPFSVIDEKVLNTMYETIEELRRQRDRQHGELQQQKLRIAQLEERLRRRTR